MLVPRVHSLHCCCVDLQLHFEDATDSHQPFQRKEVQRNEEQSGLKQLLASRVLPGCANCRPDYLPLANSRSILLFSLHKARDLSSWPPNLLTYCVDNPDKLPVRSAEIPCQKQPDLP